MLCKKLMDFAMSRADIGNDKSVLRADTEIREYLLENCDFAITDENYFFVRVNCEEIMHNVRNIRVAPYDKAIKHGVAEDYYKTKALVGEKDFGHTAPLWSDIIELGIYGLHERVKQYAKKADGDSKKKEYFGYLLRYYSAVFCFMSRCADALEKAGREEAAISMRALIKRAPKNLFEAIQTVMLYYALQQYFDATYVRTLGRLDILLYSFFVKENREMATELIENFMTEINSWKANSNIPFAIGGADSEGRALVNELSYVLLDIYKKQAFPFVKLHIFYSPSTPVDLLEMAADSIRNGANSIAFMSDEMVKRSLENIGIDKYDANRYDVVGCYEPCAREEICSSCNAVVNVYKAVELAMNGGADMLTDLKIGLDCNSEFYSFKDFYKEFLRQLGGLAAKAMEFTDMYERDYAKMHSSPAFSSSYPSALESGGDIYCDYAAKYNNSSVNAIGIATAVDSLCAIKKLVFEDKCYTLKELRDILKNNWAENETLRLKIKNTYPKYGMGDSVADELAADIVHSLYVKTVGKPNAKGGVYRLGTFSIDWRIKYGKACHASADGRLSGEPLSQNTGASIGGDRNGVTALIHSVTAIKTLETVNGSVLDIDLHSSAVSGEDGLCSLIATLRTYFDRGGFAVHYNVLDSKTLRDAVDNPEKYPNLQIRLCGWNVLFTTLSPDIQREFINRAENQEKIM